MAPVRWLILALQFTTIIPTPALPNVSESELRYSVLFYPVVGLGLGSLLWGMETYFTHFLSVPAATVFSLAVYTLVTGGLHLDGLMDTADGLGSRRSRERALEIMRDSRIGAMGAIAGILLLAGKGTAIAGISGTETMLFFLVPGLSRLGMIWSMKMAPYARAESGLGKVYARKIPLWTELFATVMIGTAFWMAYSFKGIAALVLTFAFVCLYTFFMKRRFGGMTGDTYGALNELLEWLGWLFLPLLF